MLVEQAVIRVHLVDDVDEVLMQAGVVDEHIDAVTFGTFSALDVAIVVLQWWPCLIALLPCRCLNRDVEPVPLDVPLLMVSCCLLRIGSIGIRLGGFLGYCLLLTPGSLKENLNRCLHPFQSLGER